MFQFPGAASQAGWCVLGTSDAGLPLVLVVAGGRREGN